MEKFESLDIETIWKNNIAIPICIAITSGSITLFKLSLDPLEIITFMLENCKRRKIYYVHNLTFECFVFIKYLHSMGIKFNIISSNRIVYCMYIFYGKKKIVLRCSWKLTMLPLRKLADLAGIEEKGIFPYKILDVNLKKYVKLMPHHFNMYSDYVKFCKKYGNIVNIFKILEEYCINDVIITKKSIIVFWNIILSNNYVNNVNILTAARLSVETFFKNFNENKLVKKKIKVELDRIIRKGYFGGRTEVFGNPDRNEICLHFDWSGMYAQCMSEKVPCGEVYIENDPLDLSKPGFYLIKFKQDMSIPILPVKKNKLYFMNGCFEGWYWFEEIMLFIEYGGEIIEIKKAVLSTYYRDEIKKFVEVNDNIRSKGGLYKLIGKNNNNTFYGRLGMDPERMDETIFWGENFKEFDRVIEILGIKLGYSKSYKSTSNVFIAACITSKARIKLYRGFMDVIKIGGRILYCDTDSIIASFKLSEYKNVLDRQFGEVYFDSKDAQTIIKDAVFALPKTYALKYSDSEVVKIKGFNVKPNFNKFKWCFYNGIELETKNMMMIKKDFQIRVEYDKVKRTKLNTLEKRIWEYGLKRTIPVTSIWKK